MLSVVCSPLVALLQLSPVRRSGKAAAVVEVGQPVGGIGVAHKGGQVVEPTHVAVVDKEKLAQDLDVLKVEEAAEDIQTSALGKGDPHLAVEPIFVPS